jgi:hypothetical protein
VTLLAARQPQAMCDQYAECHKSAQEQLDKAEQCFDLGDEGRDLAEKLHDSATKQLDIAAKQQSIGNEQHIQADKLDEQAVKSDDLGRLFNALSRLNLAALSFRPLLLIQVSDFDQIVTG